MNYLHPSRRFKFSALVIIFVMGSFSLLAQIGTKESSTFHVRQEGVRITGNISNKMGERLQGATVLEKGTTNGVLSNDDGTYSINVLNKNAVLRFSSMGYLTQDVKVRDNLVTNVILEESLTNMEEVVVVAYGTQKKETLTGAVSTLRGQEIVKSPQPNVGTALAGRLSGVTIINRSGSPGAEDLTVLIRGQATTGNNSPLIVLDGIPQNGQGGLERINPDDIENISVLKDASAALYGAQAANGAILITTKRGRSGETNFNYNFNQGFVALTSLPQMSSSAEYVKMLNESAYYTNPNGGLYQKYSESDIKKFQDGSDPVNFPNTNWMKAFLKDYSSQSQHNLSVRGGSKNTAFSVSAALIDVGSIYENGISDYKQYNVRSNLDIRVNKRFNIKFDISGRQENRINPSGWPDAGRAGIFKVAYRTYPFIPVIWPNGTYSSGVGDGRNPLLMVSNAAGANSRKFNVINGTIRASYDIPGVTGLSIDGYFSVNQDFNFVKAFAKSWITYNYNRFTDKYTERGGGATAPNLVETHSNESDVTGNLKLNYSRKFGNHDITALISVEQNTNNYYYFNARRENFIQTQLQELSFGGASASDASNGSNSSSTARQNYFARSTYNFKQKYLAEVQIGYNGSTTFAKGNRFGLFPGVLLGWRMSEEPWFKNKLVTNLKIRGSYGELGNDKVSLFQFYDNFGLNTSAFVVDQQAATTITYSKVANPGITWEVARKTDIGIEARFFNRLYLEIDLFNENRSNILGTRLNTLPQVSGISGSLIPSENLYSTQNRGIEVQVNYSQNLNDHFYFNVGGNFTYAKNKVTFADESPIIPDYQLQKGKPISAMGSAYLMYEAIGIFKDEADLASSPHIADQKVGDIKFRDINGDNVINSNDRVRQNITSIPQIQYGLNFSSKFKNLDLTILFQGAERVKNYLPEDAGEGGNFSKEWSDNRWSPSNPNGTWPRADSRSDASPSGGIRYVNTFWLRNSAYLRLKNVELGYSLPSLWISKVGLSSVRILASGFNLMTFTKLKDYDPEGLESGVAATAFFPQNKTYNLGLDIKF